MDAKLPRLNKKINSSKTKHLFVKNEIKKLNNSDATYFRGKTYFDDDSTQSYLVFQPVYKYFERAGNEVSSWVSKGLSNEKISSVSNSNDSVSKIGYDNAKMKVKFNGNLLKQNKVTYNYGSIENIYVVYRLTPKINLGGIGPTLQNCLFGAVELAKMLILVNTNILDMVLGLIQEDVFHIRVEDMVEMLLFEAVLSSSTHSNIKTKSILVRGKDFIKGIDTNFTVDNKKFCLSLHYNGDNSYLFVNGEEIVRDCTTSITSREHFKRLSFPNSK